MPISSSAAILIVDDSATMRKILRDMLTRLGFRNVEEAEDGRIALSKIQGRSYALIISDWHMEPVSGIEFLREVCRRRTPGTNKFIMVTTEGNWGNQTTARIDGADAFLSKPFALETLKAKVEGVLSR